MGKTFYIISFGSYDRYYFTLWEVIADLSKIDLEVQKN